MNWKDFKALVKEMRVRQRELMNFQSGCNKVMIEISVIDEDDHGNIGLGSISFTPHAIDLRTGKVFSYHNSLDKWTWFNVKELLNQ